MGQQDTKVREGMKVSSKEDMHGKCVEAEYYFVSEREKSNRPYQSFGVQHPDSVYMATTYVENQPPAKYFGDNIIEYLFHVCEDNAFTISTASGEDYSHERPVPTDRIYVRLYLKPVNPQELEGILDVLRQGFIRVRQDVIKLAREYDKTLEKVDRLF